MTKLELENDKDDDEDENNDDDDNDDDDVVVVVDAAADSVDDEVDDVDGKEFPCPCPSPCCWPLLPLLSLLPSKGADVSDALLAFFTTRAASCSS